MSNLKWMQKLKWMECLKVGDEVILVKDGLKQIKKITSISKKSIFVDGEQFNKWNGAEGTLNDSHYMRKRKYLHSVHDSYLEEVTNMNQLKIKEERKERIEFLTNYRYEVLSEKDLEYAFKNLKIEYINELNKVEIMKNFSFKSISEENLNEMYRMFHFLDKMKNL